jgi:S1-C subfamily serine protease
MAQGAQSIGFAIPSNQIQKVVNQVKTTGKISSPYIGVRYVELDDAIRKEINIPYNYGVLVVRGESISDFAVIPGSPADKAGIMENDVILEINDTKIDKKNTLVSLIAKNNVGDVVRLKVWHKGDIKEMSLKLEEKS